VQALKSWQITRHWRPIIAASGSRVSLNRITEELADFFGEVDASRQVPSVVRVRRGQWALACLWLLALQLSPH